MKNYLSTGEGKDLIKKVAGIFQIDVLDKKGGKVVARQMLFLVAKRNEKGECKFINVMIQQDMQADGTWGKPYVDAGTPAAGSPDCACIEKMKDWYRP